MPVRCTEHQDLSTSTGTYERVNVNRLSLSSPDFMVVGPSLHPIYNQ